MTVSDAELAQLVQIAQVLISEAAGTNLAPQNMALTPTYVQAMVNEIQASRASAKQAAAQRGNNG